MFESSCFSLERGVGILKFRLSASDLTSRAVLSAVIDELSFYGVATDLAPSAMPPCVGLIRGPLTDELIELPP